MTTRRSISRAPVQSGVQSAVQVGPMDWPMRGDGLGRPRTALDRPIPFFLTDAPVPFWPVEERCAELPPSRGEVP
jgi:hypothetical protein